jgi:hypothetical protein
MQALWRSKTRVRASRGPTFGGGSASSIFIKITMSTALPPRKKAGPGAYARAYADTDAAVAEAFAAGERALGPTSAPESTRSTRHTSDSRLASAFPPPSPHRSARNGCG